MESKLKCLKRMYTPVQNNGIIFQIHVWCIDHQYFEARF